MELVVVVVLFCVGEVAEDDDEHTVLLLLGENWLLLLLLLLLLFRKVAGVVSGTILGEKEGDESIEEHDVGDGDGSGSDVEDLLKLNSMSFSSPK